MDTQKKYILNQDQVARKIKRLAFEIAERNIDGKIIYFAAIQEYGVVLARKIKEQLEKICSAEIRLLTVSLDKRNPDTVSVQPELPERNAVVILIDDVSSSGKTLLYAMQPFLATAPARIQTLVLVERTHKAFPLLVDYVGLSVATTLEEHIFVEVEGEKVSGAFMK
ncbi:MAG: phosphoribosyltransferase [Bacteroidetes bacterium]|nr:phosphoribosyltransferase [Bacteroidota bacterium]